LAVAAVFGAPALAFFAAQIVAIRMKQ